MRTITLRRLRGLLQPTGPHFVYELLPTSEPDAARLPARSLPCWRTWPRRTWCLLIAALLCLAMVIGLPLFLHFQLWVWGTPLLANLFGPKPLPPLYPEFRAAELALPQHHVENPFANGQKYLWIASHVSGYGWGNYMEEMIMNAHLTLRSGRTYVFDDYTWRRHGPPYSIYDRTKWIPSRIPLSAIISGPLVGGNFSDGYPTPLAVARPYFETICPRPTRVRANDIKRLYMLDGATAVQIEEAWQEHLGRIADPCVEVVEGSGGIFEIDFFGRADELLPIWPSLSSSPILQLFGWSTLAHGAFEANRQLFLPDSSTLPEDPRGRVEGLLAIHVRRGDFDQHCENLCRWDVDFNAFNSFDSFLDPWTKPEGTFEERMPAYRERCFPSIEAIVRKVEDARTSAAGRGLKYLYVMTNGDREWLAALKHALNASHEWDSIATSRDLALTWEQKFVSQSMDMLVGERAQVFIGNGFSSLTSNVAMLRMAKGFSPDSTRMW